MESFFYSGNIVTITVVIATLFGTIVVASITLLSVIIWRKSSCGCSTKEEAVYDDVKTSSRKDPMHTELTQNEVYGYLPRKSTTAST